MGKRGPKPKGEFEGKSAVLSTTITPELRARLEAAVRPGLTLSREIEHRLRRSLDEVDEKADEEAYGDRKTRGILRLIAEVVRRQQSPNPFAKEPPAWTDDLRQFDMTRAAIDIVLDAVRRTIPEGTKKAPKGFAAALSDLISRGAAADVIADLHAAEAGKPYLKEHRREREYVKARELLGPLADKLAEAREMKPLADAVRDGVKAHRRRK